jgi:hypothetical protein
MTAAAERELRELRIELLVTRAELERRQLLQQIDSIGGRTRGVRAVARALLPRSVEPALRFASTAIGIVRRQAWIVPVVAGVAKRALEARAVRWLLLFGAAAATAWWFTRRSAVSSEAVPTEEPGSAAEQSAATSPDSDGQDAL